MTCVREGAIASRIGYAAPMEEINMEGEVEIHATEDDDVEQFTEENRNAEDENDEAAMMQQASVSMGQQQTYEDMLHQLLMSMDSVPKQKAARLAEFLRQLMVDQCRLAPHLQHPRLADRFSRARIRVLVQGEGGRIIKKENWLFGLKPGERLSYNVNVHQIEEDEDERDPNAGS